MNSTINSRFEKIMIYYGLNAREFSNKIGASETTASHLVKGRKGSEIPTAPSYEILYNTLNAFREISSDWLILDVGKMIRQDHEIELRFRSIEKEIINLKKLYKEKK